MQRVSYITDSSGKKFAIVIDMEVWNSFLNFHPDAMHFIGGNTFENIPPHLNIFSGEPIDPAIVKDFEDFQNEIREKKN